MESIYTMGTQAWRQWVTYWTDKVKDKADLINGKVPESQLPITQQLEFLLVDVLATDDGQYPSEFTPFDKANYIDISVVGNHINQYKYNISTTSWDIIAGTDSNPFVPISQTTIFVHPTTFERYRFNGTTMEVYNDVDNVVPKWLKYEALLSQSGEDVPVARVLNQDERDYLGDIVWARTSIGTYIGSNSFVFSENLTACISSLGNWNSDPTNTVLGVYNSQLKLVTFVPTDASFDTFSNLYIKIKQRVRGNPPKLVSAETNTTGDKIILNTTKKLSSYFFTDILNSFIVSCENVVTEIVRGEDDKTIELSLQNNYQHGDEITISYDGIIPLESFNYGLLQPFNNVSVTNNVPAPQ